MESLNKQMLSAVSNGDLTTVEKLVREGADINYTDSWGILQCLLLLGQAVSKP